MAFQGVERQVPTIGDPLLSVSNLSRGDAVKDVSFDVHRGEVVALTGRLFSCPSRTSSARLFDLPYRDNLGPS